VVASLYGRNSLTEIISKTARRTFIPLTVAGGIRTINDIRTVLRSGADKVSLNTAAVNNPSIIREASLKFGSSTIVVSIEAIKQPDGKYLIYTDNGREYTGIEALSWAKKMEELGAGELVVTSVDNDGTGAGYDCGLVRMISENVSIPVIAHGGGGQLHHFQEVVTEGKADAISVASFLHYDYVTKVEHTMNERVEGNIEFLKSNRTPANMKPAGISQIKDFLIQKGFNCRI
jgi:cyclase